MISPEGLVRLTAERDQLREQRDEAVRSIDNWRAAVERGHHTIIRQQDEIATLRKNMDGIGQALANIQAERDRLQEETDAAKLGHTDALDDLHAALEDVVTLRETQRELVVALRTASRDNCKRAIVAPPCNAESGCGPCAARAALARMAEGE